MKINAFVFARGGSKGLPGKNIKLLKGKPLIAHSISLAQRLSQVSKIYVSTDSEEIGDVAMEYGAHVIKRPAELASDTAPEWLAWRHAVDYAATYDDFDTFLSLPSTSPLRKIEDVLGCLNELDNEKDAVIAITPSSRSPYFNMVTRQADGTCKVALQQDSITRRQDAPAIYDITTVAYVTRPRYILESPSLFHGRVGTHIIPKCRSVDIDDAYDFKIAEALFDEVMSSD